MSFLSEVYCDAVIFIDSVVVEQHVDFDFGEVGTVDCFHVTDIGGRKRRIGRKTKFDVDKVDGSLFVRSCDVVGGIVEDNRVDLKVDGVGCSADCYYIADKPAVVVAGSHVLSWKERKE